MNEDDPHQINSVRSLADAITTEVSSHGWPSYAVSSERIEPEAPEPGREPDESVSEPAVEVSHPTPTPVGGCVARAVDSDG